MRVLNIFRVFKYCLIGTVLVITILLLQRDTENVAMKQTSSVSPSPCNRIPDNASLSINNFYWQTLVSDNVSFYFLNAYYDKRYKSPVRPSIRITAMIDIRNPPNLYCWLWISSEKFVVANTSYDYIWFKVWKLKTELQPFLITCPIPKAISNLVPQYVSFVTRNSSYEYPTNLLKVIYNMPKSKKGKKKFAVCVKGLDFPEDSNGTSTRLVEWLETQWILGAELVTFYVLQIHPNIRAVLEYYKSKGRVQMIPLTLPGNQPNEPKAQHAYLDKYRSMKRLNEVIPYNDCFYRNLYLYEYIGIFDTDEVILPFGPSRTWSQMIKNSLRKSKKLCKKKGGFTSFMARNVYFMDDFLEKSHHWFNNIPRYMHMLQHVYRTANHTGEFYTKGFHRTDGALTLHNHKPLAYLNNVCKYYTMDAQDALLYHYRTFCVRDIRKENCEALRSKVVRDTEMWKYKTLLIQRTTKALIKLGFLNETSLHKQEVKSILENG